jgi:dTDP-4-amino-4,6-dideoxygalactose transaminase
MKLIQVTPDAIPRLPLIGCDTFGRPKTGVPRSLLQSPHIRYTTSGRAAIALALRELGVGPGDQVLIPTYHCPTMVSPAVFSGAKPVFFPITPSGAAAVDCLADKEFPRGQILGAHYFGIPPR